MITGSNCSESATVFGAERRETVFILQLLRVCNCFTICLFISPDLDGHRAPKMKYCP